MQALGLNTEPKPPRRSLFRYEAPIFCNLPFKSNMKPKSPCPAAHQTADDAGPGGCWPAAAATVKTIGILTKSPELITETREDVGKVWSELGVTEVAREEPPDVTEVEVRGELLDTAGNELVRAPVERLVEGPVDGFAEALDGEAVLDWRLDKNVEDCVVDVEVIDELVNEDNVENAELPELELERVPLVPELVDELEPGVELLPELGETLDEDESEVDEDDDDDDGVLDD